MFGDNSNDPLLKKGWHQFCDELRAAGDLIFRDTTPVHDIDRAKGLLIDECGLKEHDAFGFIQRTAMSERTRLRAAIDDGADLATGRAEGKGGRADVGPR